MIIKGILKWDLLQVTLRKLVSIHPCRKCRREEEILLPLYQKQKKKKKKERKKKEKKNCLMTYNEMY